MSTTVRRQTIASFALAAAMSCAAMGASAASYLGEFWDASSNFSTVDAAIDHAETTSRTASFQSTAIDYPGASSTVSVHTKLVNFLGATGDGLTLDGAQNNKLGQSVFRFSGWVDVTGTKSISVGSDDGFLLSFDGSEVIRHTRHRGFGVTRGTYDFDGPTQFVLYYFENGGNTGVEFKIDGAIVDSSIATVAPTAVPLPAGLVLLPVAIGGLVALRRARRA